MGGQRGIYRQRPRAVVLWAHARRLTTEVNEDWIIRSRLTDMKGNNAYLKAGRAMGRSAGEVRAVAYGLLLC